MDPLALALVELGAVVFCLGLLARLAGRIGMSPIPLYLVGGLAFGAGGFVRLDGNGSLARVRVIPSGHEEFGLAFAKLHDTDATARGRDEILTDPKAREFSLIHVHISTLTLLELHWYGVRAQLLQ
jgi:hypothetical protein